MVSCIFQQRNRKGLSLIKTALQDALEREGNKLKALPCIELVLELHPENTRQKGKDSDEDYAGLKTTLHFCVIVFAFFVFLNNRITNKKVNDHKIDLF